VSTRPTAAAKVTATTATTTYNKNVTQSSLGDRDRAAARVGNVLVVNAAIGVGAGSRIAEVCVTGSAKSYERRTVPHFRRRRVGRLVKPNETFSRRRRCRGAIGKGNPRTERVVEVSSGEHLARCEIVSNCHCVFPFN
jgi:hypothetical protein